MLGFLLVSLWQHCTGFGGNGRFGWRGRFVGPFCWAVFVGPFLLGRFGRKIGEFLRGLDWRGRLPGL